MTDLRAAAEMALDALERGTTGLAIRAIPALRQALAQGEQEPVTWRNAAIRLGEDLYSVGPNGYYDMTAKEWLDWALSVVTAPPSKPWASLTDDEKLGAIWTNGSFSSGVEWAEAKLKEKNT